MTKFLRVSTEQIAAMSECAVNGFIDYACNFLYQNYSGQCKLVGRTQVRMTAKLGILRAKFHGYTTEHGVLSYLRMMFMLGSSFDCDPQYPWVYSMLTSAPQTDPYLSMCGLLDRAWQYQATVAGSNLVHLQAALDRLQRSTLEEILPSPSGDIVQDSLCWLGETYPTKRAVVTRSIAEQILNAAKKVYARPPVQSRDLLIAAGFIYLFGHEFHRDPLHPWAAAALMASNDGGSEAIRLVNAAREVGHRLRSLK